MPPVTRKAPRASKSPSRPARTRSRLSRAKAPRSATALKGTLMKSTQRQPGPSVSRPPKRTPEGPPAAPADPGDGRPHAEGGVAVTRAAKRARQRREGGWRHHGCPDSLRKAGANEQRAGVGQTAEQGRAWEG